MKECKYCGTQCQDDVDKCPNCGGNKFYTEQELTFELKRQQKEIDNQARSITIPGINKKRLFGILGGIVAVIVIIIAITSYASNRPLSNGMTTAEGEELLSTGIAYLENGDYEAAIECFLELPPDSKQYSKAQSLLEQSKESYREMIIDRVNLQLENKEFDAAFNLISKAKELLPDDHELKSTYDTVYTAYRASVLEQVETYVSNDQYELALEYLATVQKKYPNDAVLQDSYDTTISVYHATVRTNAIEQADEYIVEKDYKNAIKIIRSALDVVKDDELLLAQLDVCSKEYVSVVIESANAQYNRYNEKSISSSIDTIKEGLELLPNNPLLLEAKISYEELLPIFPWALDYYTIDRHTYQIEPEMKDNYGKVHYKVFVNPECKGMGWPSDHVGRDFYLNKEYGKLSGTLFRSYDKRGNSFNPYLNIYCDDVLVYQHEVTIGEEPVHFDIDLSGVTVLYIVFDCWDDGFCGGIEDFYLYKN